MDDRSGSRILIFQECEVLDNTVKFLAIHTSGWLMNSENERLLYIKVGKKSGEHDKSERQWKKERVIRMFADGQRPVRRSG